MTRVDAEEMASQQRNHLLPYPCRSAPLLLVAASLLLWRPSSRVGQTTLRMSALASGGGSWRLRAGSRNKEKTEIGAERRIEKNNCSLKNRGKVIAKKKRNKKKTIHDWRDQNKTLEEFMRARNQKVYKLPEGHFKPVQNSAVKLESPCIFVGPSYKNVSGLGGGRRRPEWKRDGSTAWVPRQAFKFIIYRWLRFSSCSVVP